MQTPFSKLTLLLCILVIQCYTPCFFVWSLTYNEAAFQFSFESKWMGLSLFSFVQGGKIHAKFHRFHSSTYYNQPTPNSDPNFLDVSSSTLNASSLFNVSTIHTLSIFTCPILPQSSLYHHILFSANSGWLEDNFPSSFALENYLDPCTLLTDPSNQCQVQLVYHKTFLLTIDALSHKFSHTPHPNPISPNILRLDPIQFHVNASSPHLTGLAKCPKGPNPNPNLKFSVSGELSFVSTNPKPFFFNPFHFITKNLSQLPSGLHPLLSIYPFLFICYTFIVYFWKTYYHAIPSSVQALPTFFAFPSNRFLIPPISFLRFLMPSPILLQQLLFLIPITRWCSTLYLCFYYSYVSQYGTMHVFTEVVRVLLWGVSLLSIHSIILLISKGFSITRTRLAGVEARSILGLVMFLSISEIFYALVCGSSLFSMALITPIFGLYMHWGFYQHLRNLKTYILELKSCKVHPEILSSYQSKYGLLSQSAQVFRAFLIAIILSKFSVLITYPTYTWISIFSEELCLLFITLYFCISFRSPPYKPISLYQ